MKCRQVDLNDLGNLGELVSAIAVVVSLIYLAFQIRENSKQSRISCIQQMLEASREMILTTASDEYLSLLQREREDKDSLSDQEQLKLRFLRMAQLRNRERIYSSQRKNP